MEDRNYICGVVEGSVQFMHNLYYNFVLYDNRILWSAMDNGTTKAFIFFTSKIRHEHLFICAKGRFEA
jgi:hypothetical protein